MTTLYVEDYGAVGDGQTDDYPAIQAALDAAGNMPGLTIVTTRNPDRPFRLSQGVRLRGYGIGFEHIWLMAQTGETAIFYESERAQIAYVSVDAPCS